MLSKADDFLRYAAVFLLLASVVSFVVIAVFYILSPSSFCYELVDSPSVAVGNYSFFIGERVSDCKLVSVDELHRLTRSYRVRFVLGLFCFLGWVLVNPDFWSGLKEKFKYQRCYKL